MIYILVGAYFGLWLVNVGLVWYIIYGWHKHLLNHIRRKIK